MCAHSSIVHGSIHNLTCTFKDSFAILSSSRFLITPLLLLLLLLLAHIAHLFPLTIINFNNIHADDDYLYIFLLISCCIIQFNGEPHSSTIARLCRNSYKEGNLAL